MENESPADPRPPGFFFFASPSIGRALGCAALAAALVACDAGEGPYLAFAGGGFIFNYRLASAEYGFVARVMRPLPAGSLLEAEFEDPAGGAPISVREASRPGRRSYHFQTPPVTGIEAGRDYRVVLRLLDADGTELARYSRTFHADVSQDVLPESPPVVGPGYQPAP